MGSVYRQGQGRHTDFAHLQASRQYLDMVGSIRYNGRDGDSFGWLERRGGGGEWNWRFLHKRKGFRFSVSEGAKSNLDIMGTILFKPYQDLGEGLFFDN